MKKDKVLFLFFTVTSLCYSSRKNPPGLFTDLEASGSGDGDMINPREEGRSGFSSGSGSGSGSGSDSGSGVNPPPAIAKNSSNSCTTFIAPFALVNENDAVLEGRCRSLCIEKTVQSSSLSVELFLENGFYNSVSTKSLRKNCPFYQKHDRCILSSEVYLPDSSCTSNCDRLSCSLGCVVNRGLKLLRVTGMVPLSPIFSYSVDPFSSPTFHAAATYKISWNNSDNYYNTSSSLNQSVVSFNYYNTSSSLNQSVVSFVVQVSYNELTTHYWLPSLDTPLQIESFLGCKEVQIRLLPVNKHGPAVSYSSSISIDTYGDIWPPLPDHPPPYSLTISQEDDERTDFWEHAILNMSWKPPNRAQYLTSYTVRIISPDHFLCGPSKDITGLNQSRCTWGAESPADGPINNCTYQILVLSEPQSTTYPGPQESVVFTVMTTSNGVPSNGTFYMETTCFINDTGNDFMFFKPTISWTLPLNPALAKGISHFVVNTSAWRMFNDDLVKLKSWKSTLIEFADNREEHITQEVGYNTSYNLLVQEFTIVYSPGHPQYLSPAYFCYHHLYPPPPVTVLTPKYLIWNNGRLYLDVSWSEPEFLQGNISHYEVYVWIEGTVLNNTQPSPIAALFTSDVPTTNPRTILFDIVNLTESTVFFLKVRVVSSLGIKSVWSIPYQYNPHSSDFLLDFNISCYGRVGFDLAPFRTYLLFVEWTVPPVIMGLEKFKVALIGIRESNNGVTLRELYVLFENSRTVYFKEFEHYLSDGKDFTSFVFKLDPFYIADYPERTPRDGYSCYINITNIPPTRVSFVSVNTFIINQYGELDISLMWEEPEVAAGGISEYWLYIGVSPLSGSAVPHDHLILKKGILNTTYTFTEEMDSKFEEAVKSFNTTASLWKFYVQIMAISNEESVSEWSEPFYIEMRPFSLLDKPILSTLSLNDSVAHSTFSETPFLISTDNPVKKDEIIPGPLVTMMSAMLPIILILVAVNVLLFAVLFVARFQYRTKRKEKCNQTLGTEACDEWEVCPDNVEKLKCIGEGTFGEVYQGCLWRTRKGREDKVPVFINSLRATCTDDDALEFMHLLEKHKKMSNVQHPFLIAMVGCVTMDQIPCLITELADNGDLLSFLHNHKISSSVPYHKKLENQDLITFASQIASAMDFLSGLGVVHSDLAARNVYIDQSHTLKVADFGVVTKGTRDTVYIEGRPLRWLSPQVIVGHAYSTTSDIWAFGVTVWEIFTLGEFPYQNVTDKEMLSFLQNGGRLSISSNYASSKLITTLLTCWEGDPEVRPSFEVLHKMLLEELDVEKAVTIKSKSNFLKKNSYNTTLKKKNKTKVCKKGSLKSVDEVESSVISRTCRVTSRTNTVNINDNPLEEEDCEETYSGHVPESMELQVPHGSFRVIPQTDQAIHPLQLEGRTVFEPDPTSMPLGGIPVLKLSVEVCDV